MADYSELRRLLEACKESNCADADDFGRRIAELYDFLDPETVAAMVSEVESLRKDAMRYRWLRVKQTFIWLIQDWFPKDKVLTDVDAEIDAAMSKEPDHD